ncbi:MAG: helix-turn-helix domain-containing protein [Actinobacteria bacterium]|nr:helix-turn-helix domain-containing protein [Actinomycetota bacterium]
MPETSKTADQALTVLLELTKSGATTPAELARRLEMNRTVVHRLLATLHGRGFVTRTDAGYAPGAILVALAERVQPELRAAAASVMSELGGKIGETAVMHIADGDDAMVLEEYVATGHVVRVEHEIGSRHPLAKGASGRALLAYLDDTAIARVLRRSDNAEALNRQLELVRQLGYALSHDELQEGVHGLAVPVFDRPGHALASLAIIVPTTRAAGISDHLDELLAASERVAASLYGESVRA